MPQNNNISTPLSKNLSATTGVTAASSIGMHRGSSLARQAFNESTIVSNQKMSERDSLLAVLEALAKEPKADEAVNIPSLQLFPEIKAALADSANVTASLVSRVTVASATAVTHISQLGLDLTAAIQGIFNSVHHPEKFNRPDAFELNVANEIANHQSGFSANCRALSAELRGILRQLDVEINKKFGKERFAQSHVSAAELSASLPVSATVTVSAVLSAALDTMGAIFRESTGLVHFLDGESEGSEQEKNIYHQFTVCMKVFKDSKDSRASFKALKDLEKAISNFDPAVKLSSDHGLAGPNISVFVRMLASGAFVTALRAVNSSAIAVAVVNEAVTENKDVAVDITKRSLCKASTINENINEGRVPSQNLSELTLVFDSFVCEVNAGLGLAANESDNKMIGLSAEVSARLGSVISAIPLVITDFVGVISREVSGAIDFTQNDKGSKQEFDQVMKTRKENSGADLDALMARVSQLKERLERCQELGVSAPVVLGASEVVTCGALVATLNSVAGICFALRELHSVSEYPYLPTQPDEDEQKKAKEYKESVVASHQKSAKNVGLESASENVSLHQHLQSVMEKIVLVHRSNLDFLQPGAERKDINSSGKSTIAFSQGNSTGFLSGALGILALVGLETGVSVETFFRALGLASAQCNRLSDGVDKIKTGDHSQSNLSFISNATRLSADKDSASRSSSKTTNRSSESTFSRTLTVSLCHSGVLREALRKLSKEEEDKLVHNPLFLDSVLVSDAVMDKLADHIVRVLNNAEGEDRQIPGLNQDMADQLASGTRTRIATTLSAHSLFIMPFLQSIAAVKAAKNINDRDKNEALSDDSIGKLVSQASNILQAFTKNCIEALNKNVDNPSARHNNHHSAMKTHISSNRVNATAMVASCCLSLLCEELLEMTFSRSLALFDKNKIENASNQALDVVREAATNSSGHVIDDSDYDNYGKAIQVTHAISALRLTLSHLGQSLAKCAREVREISERKDHDFMQPKHDLHSSQHAMLSCLASSLSQCSLRFTEISGMISMLPLTANSIDEIRRAVHSLDHDLRMNRVQSSAKSTRSSHSEVSLISGLSTDSVSDVVVNLAKLLVRSASMGLETTLSVSKVLAILSLHQRPEQALLLESQALSMPNGVLANIQSQTQSASVGASVVAATFSEDTKVDGHASQSTNNSILSVQNAIDRAIDRCAVLSDEEEDTIDLKDFFEVLIRVSARHKYMSIVRDDDCKDLVGKFNLGSISLANFHSKHGGVYGKNDVRAVNELLKHDLFMGCDDVSSLIEAFIRKAAANEFNKAEGQNSLLKIMQIELSKCHKKMSVKSKNVWSYIIERVADKLVLTNQSNQFYKPRVANQRPFDRNEFLELLKYDVSPPAAQLAQRDFLDVIEEDDEVDEFAAGDHPEGQADDLDAPEGENQERMPMVPRLS